MAKSLRWLTEVSLSVLLVHLFPLHQASAENPRDWVTKGEYVPMMSEDLVFPLDAYLTADRRDYDDAFRLMYISGFGSCSIVFLTDGKKGELIYERSTFDQALNIEVFHRRLYHPTAKECKMIADWWKDAPPAQGKSEKLQPSDDGGFISSESLIKGKFSKVVYVIRNVFDRFEKTEAKILQQLEKTSAVK